MGIRSGNDFRAESAVAQQHLSHRVIHSSANLLANACATSICRTFLPVWRGVIGKSRRLGLIYAQLPGFELRRGSGIVPRTLQ
jgi:hypothetical protein